MAPPEPREPQGLRVDRASALIPQQRARKHVFNYLLKDQKRRSWFLATAPTLAPAGPETFERDKERLLESYATLGPEALDALDPEERRTVYSMLGVCVEALPDKSLRVRGAFGEENPVWEKERTSRRSFTEANPPSDSNKTFGFTVILREGVVPDTSLRVLNGI